MNTSLQEKEYTHTFTHKLFPEIKLERVEENGKRLYLTPSGNKYPSVTTALGYLSRKKIMEWRKRVGNEEANRIGTRAANAGTAVHNIAEKFLLNDETWKDTMPIPLSRFNKIRPFLEKNVNEIYGIEHRMYSDQLCTAGTADLICSYNNIPTILDFKTSSRAKSEKEILSYFMQSTAYAIMVEELYGKKIEQIVILMAVHEDDPLEFINTTKKYEILTRKFFKFYNEGLLM